MTHFFHSVWNEKKMVCFELSVSCAFRMPIVSNMTHFYHNAFDILLANFLSAEYLDEYPAGWYLVFARKANPRTYLATP